LQLCVSLDLNERENNLKLVRELKEFDNIWLKVGFRSFIRDGIHLLNEIKSINENFNIFLDLKLYDIPNTMADASEEIAKLNIDMFNIHASAGSIAMNEVVNRLKEAPEKPLILSVTALTSFDESEFSKVYNSSIEERAKEFAKMSFKSGIDGVVCSAFESKMIKEFTDESFLTLCPAIRPFNEASNDQKRVANLEIARENLVDFIVVGRPIYRDSDPKGVVKRILENI
jgi:orotidine-5'-phosphate decarboxylase